MQEQLLSATSQKRRRRSSTCPWLCCHCSSSSSGNWRLVIDVGRRSHLPEPAITSSTTSQNPHSFAPSPSKMVFEHHLSIGFVIWKVNKAEVGCWGSRSYQRWPHCDSIVAVVTNIFNPLCPTRRNRIVGAEHFIVHCPLWWVNAPKMFTSRRGGNIKMGSRLTITEHQLILRLGPTKDDIYPLVYN